MITISREAIAKAEQFIVGSETMDWFFLITWRKGAADNRRSADGSVAWSIEPDEGWAVELAGLRPGKISREEGTPLFGNVRVLINPQFAPKPFAGGEIYVDHEEFKLRWHAI